MISGECGIFSDASLANNAVKHTFLGVSLSNGIHCAPNVFGLDHLKNIYIYLSAAFFGVRKALILFSTISNFERQQRFVCGNDAKL